jgi:hypothetical protein
MIASNIVDLGLLDELPNLRILQMLRLVAVGGRKIGAETSVVSSNDHTTPAGWLLLVVTVFHSQTGFGAEVL